MNVKIHEPKDLKIKINNPLVLITGDGRFAREEIDRFLEWNIPHDVYPCCRSIKLYPGKVDHWTDVDAEAAVWWAEHLPREKLKETTLRHTIGEMRGFDVDWDVTDEPWDPKDIMWHGSTALFAVYTALAMGYQKIVLAGCPLDGQGHWYSNGVLGPRWVGETYTAWLDFAETWESTKVRSMSGYTQVILGNPLDDWFAA